MFAAIVSRGLWAGNTAGGGGTQTVVQLVDRLVVTMQDVTALTATVQVLDSRHDPNPNTCPPNNGSSGGGCTPPRRGC